MSDKSVYEFKNKELFLEYINSRPTPEVKEEGVWQEFLNYVHEEWQRTKGSLEEILNWIDETHGNIGVILFNLAKFNYQICNGGITQYVGNDYHGGPDFPYLHQISKFFYDEDTGVCEGFTSVICKICDNCYVEDGYEDTSYEYDEETGEEIEYTDWIEEKYITGDLDAYEKMYYQYDFDTKMRKPIDNYFSIKYLL